jgi:molybdopterin synthase catalytic subunit
MKVRLLLFGPAADAVGPLHEAFALPTGATAGDVVSAAQTTLPAAAAILARGPFAVAVNRAYVRPGHPLAEGDEVALIPPVSGG